MNDYLLVCLFISVSLAIGYFLGSLISGLKSKSVRSKIEEQNNQLKLKIEDLNSLYTNNLEELKNTNYFY